MAVFVPHDRADVLAGILDDHVVTARVIRQECGEVVYFAPVGHIQRLASSIYSIRQGQPLLNWTVQACSRFATSARAKILCLDMVAMAS
jgi:hypothetical protein